MTQHPRWLAALLPALTLGVLFGAGTEAQAQLFGASRQADPLKKLLVSPRVADELGGYSIRWQAPLGLPAGENLMHVEVLGDRVVAFESGNLVSVMDADNGKVLWRAAIGKPIENFTRPNRYLNGLVMCSETRAHVYDINQGELMGIFPLEHTTRTPPVIYEGMIVCGGTNGVLFAHELERGLVTWKYNMRAPINTAPILSGSTLIATTDRGEVAAFNPRSGVLLWRETTFKAIGAMPYTAHLMAYVPSTDESLYAFDRNSGRIRWRHFEQEPIEDSPVVLGTIVMQYVKNKGTLALDAFKGKLLWTRSDINDRYLPIQVKDNLLYVFKPGVGMLMLAPKDGLTAKKVPLPKVGRVLTDDTNGGNLYLIHSDGRIMKLTKKP